MVSPRQTIEILHVDDEEAVLDFVKQFISEQDPALHFTTTTSPNTAIQLLYEKNFDCIILDYKMPDMTGIELAIKIRERSTVPIILYTGQGSEEVAEQAYAAGIDDYIRKEAHPAHYQVLAKRISHVIERHRLDELYRTVVESCPDGCSISKANVTLYMNHKMAEIFGFDDPLKTSGENFLPWIVEEDRDVIHQRNRRLEEGETASEIVHYRYIREGETRYLESHGTAIVFEGAPATLAFTRDVTNTTRMENALKESEEKYRNLAENAADTLFIIDLNGAVTYTSKQINPITGFTRDETVGRSVIDLTDPEHRESGSNLLKEMQGGAGFKPFRMWIRTKNKPILTEFNPSPIMRDGKLIGIQVVMRDISNRLEYEHKLEALHSHSATIATAYTLEEIYKITLDTIESVLGFHLLSFMIPREDGFISVDNRRSASLGRALPIDGPGITVKAAREKRTLRVNDVRLDPDFVKGTTDSLSELAVPVILEGETVAIINLESTELNAFSKEDQNLIEIIAEHTASSIKKLRLIENERRNYEKLEALHRHAAQLTSLENVNEIAEFSMAIINNVLGHHYGSFALIEGDRLNFLDTPGFDPATIPEMRLDGRGLTVKAVRTGRTQLVRDTRNDPDYVHHLKGEPSLSELDVPIIVDGDVVGVINLESTQTNAYNEEDARIIEILSEHIASAIKKLRLLESVRASEAKLEALQRHAVHLSEMESLKEIAAFTLDVIGEVLGHSSGTFMIVKGDKLAYFSVKGADPTLLPEMKLDGTGITIRAVRTKETQLVNDTRLDPDYVHDPSELNLSELDVPVIVDDDVVGVINLESKDPGEYTAEDRHIVEILSEHVALAIKRLSLLEAEQRNKMRLEALNRSATDLAQSKSIGDAIDAACEILARFGFTWVGIGRVDREAIAYVKYVGSDLTGDDKIPLSRRSVTVRAVKTGELQLVRDSRKDPDYIQLGDTPDSILSELVVLVRLRGTVGYVINVESRVLDFFSDEDVRLVDLLAMHLGSALTMLGEKEKLARIHRHAPLFALARDADEVARLIFEAVKDVFSYPVAGFHVVRGNAVELAYVKGFTVNGPFTQPIDGPGLIPYAVREKKTMLVPDVRVNPHYVPGPIGDDVRLSELVTPVIAQGRVAAVINLEDSRVGAFTEEDQRLVELLAVYVGTALELIEEKRQLQEQQMQETRELLEGANRISSMVRHDLRGPLQSIKNATFLAEQQPEKARDMLDAIDKSVDYASKILDDLRNSTAPIKLVKAVVNVNDLVEQSLAAAVIPEDIVVRRNYSEGFVAASLDSTRIRRALDNLIKNAVEAMPRGGELTASVTKTGETFEIGISDTGVGIPQETMDNLFRPFFTTKPRGTGLGLAVCRQAVEAHGGSIAVASEPGKGSTFTIKLPLRD